MSSKPQPWPLHQWRTELRNAISSVDALAKFLGTELTTPAEIHFPVRVPVPFASRMRASDPDDPLLLQVLPSDAVPPAGDSIPSFTADPLEERAAIPAPGLIQKFHGRALVITTPACAVHCQYCFRQHFAYEENNSEHCRKALAHVRGHPDIEEVILSGGDPLVLVDKSLQRLVSDIEAIPHVRRLRIHTRVPIVLPSRVTQELLDTLRNTRLTVVVVVHVNHANELDEDTARALRCLAQTSSQAGRLTLLNQSVLLRGVNDDVDAQCELALKLFEQSVLPYYLHLLDLVKGAERFYIDDDTALGIFADMEARLPGYLLPKLVREEAGRRAKTMVSGTIS